MIETILIVDDNEEILEFLTKVLTKSYELHLATNGIIAQEILKNNTIDLIISDVMMPGIDGFELCTLIKSNVALCHIPIILLTSKNSYKAHIEGLEVGADLYVRKPFSPQLLRVQVANLLQNRVKIKTHFANSPFEDVRVVSNSKTDEIFLKRLEEYVSININDPYLNIDQLADHMNMSRPTFYRKIKTLSTLSPKELIEVSRLKRVTKLIAQNEFTFSEIAEMCGYGSQSSFNKSFLRYFEVSPNEFKNALCKETKNPNETLFGNP